MNAHLKECERYRKREWFGKTHPWEEKEMNFYLKRRLLLYNAGRIQTTRNQKVSSWQALLFLRDRIYADRKYLIKIVRQEPQSLRLTETQSIITNS